MKIRLIGTIQGVTMLYVRRNKVLTVERQMTDDRDVLDRLKRGIQSAHPARSIKNTRVGIRPAVVITYDTEIEARAAERWIDNSFDA